MTELSNGHSTGADADRSQIRQRNIGGIEQSRGAPREQPENDDFKKLQKVSAACTSARSRRLYLRLKRVRTLYFIEAEPKPPFAMQEEPALILVSFNH